MMARLGDVATYVNGYAFKPTDWGNEGLPIIRIQDLTGNSYQANRFNGKYHPKYEVNDGDVLISWSASLGVYVWRGEKSVLNQHIFKVVFDKVDIDKSFFVHQVKNVLEKAASEAHGATMKHLTKPIFDSLPFYLPNMETQKEIASVLDKVSGLIVYHEMQLAKLDELVKSRFIELFIGKGYPVTSIKELLVQNSTVEKISNTKIEKFVTVGIKGKGAREREIKDGKWPVPFSGYRVKEGQFIYSRIDARNGAFAILPKEVDGAVVSKDFPVFEIKADKMLPNVLLFSVLQDDFVRQIQNSSFGATNRQRIQEEVFGEYTITLPPMEIQNQFAAFVEQVDKSKLAIQQSLEKLETLKKALMQKYFG